MLKYYYPWTPRIEWNIHAVAVFSRPHCSQPILRESWRSIAVPVKTDKVFKKGTVSIESIKKVNSEPFSYRNQIQLESWRIDVQASMQANGILTHPLCRASVCYDTETI